MEDQALSHTLSQAILWINQELDKMIASFYWWKKWVLKRWNDLPKVKTPNRWHSMDFNPDLSGTKTQVLQSSGSRKLTYSGLEFRPVLRREQAEQS